MSMFDEATTEETSPEEGQEVETAVETEEETSTEEQEEQQEEQTADEQETEEESEEESSSEKEQGDELLLGKFKSVEDLVKSYKNLEKSFHGKQQKPETKQTTSADDDESPADLIQRAFMEDPAGTIQYFIDQALAPEKERRDTESLTKNMETVTQDYGKQLSTDEGVQAYFDKISELSRELGNPGLIKNPPARVLRMAAEELWGTESKQSVYDKAKDKAREEAEIARQAKKGLNAPKGAKKSETPKTAEELIKESIMNAGHGGGLFG